MTNPIRSLNKFPRRPFREKSIIINRNELPLTLPSLDLNESDGESNDLLDEVTTNMANRHFSKNLNKSSRQNFDSYSENSCRPLNEDFELINRLMKRVKQLEMSKCYQEKELKAKAIRIKVLQDKLDLYDNVRDIHRTDEEKMKELEGKCCKLQGKIDEMETFLADYGLVWVGDKSVRQGDEMRIEETEEVLEEKDEPDWVISGGFVVDYDKIITNIKELNQLVNADENEISVSTRDRATFVRKDQVKLTLFANGILLFDGPFRSFDEESSRIIIQDLSDGFFPSELESRYPFGVPLKVTDRRNIYYEVKSPVIFQGPGRMLGGSNVVSSLIIKNKEKAPKFTQPYDKIMSGNDSSNPSGTKKMTMNQFLQRLPTSTITNEGKIVSIRKSIQEILENKSPMSTVSTGIGTETTENPCSQRPPPPSPSSTSSKEQTRALIKLRIPSHHDSEKLYQMEISATETIYELYNRFSVLANLALGSFHLATTFPKRLLNMSKHETISDAGLVPNAFLLVELNNQINPY